MSQISFCLVVVGQKETAVQMEKFDLESLVDYSGFMV